MHQHTREYFYGNLYIFDHNIGITMPHYQYARNICEHLKTKVIHFVFLKYIFFLIITFTYVPGYQMNQRWGVSTVTMMNAKNIIIVMFYSSKKLNWLGSWINNKVGHIVANTCCRLVCLFCSVVICLMMAASVRKRAISKLVNNVVWLGF